MFASTTPTTRTPDPAQARTDRPLVPPKPTQAAGPRRTVSTRPALATVDGPAEQAVPRPLLVLAHAYVALSDILLPYFDKLTYIVNGLESVVFGPDSRPMHAGGALVITGAGSGIGLNAATTLARKGLVVYAGVHKPEDVPRLARLGLPTLVPLVLDVTSTASIRLAKQHIEDDLRVRQANLTGIVNVAGIIVSTAMEAATRDDMLRVYDVNVFGPLHVTQAFLPLIRRHGLGGRIVLIGSVASWATAPHAAVYCSSKRAAEGVFEGLRQELAHEGIHVAIIRPGGVSTAIGAKVEADPTKGQAFAKFAELLMKDIGIAPEHIARHITHALTAQFPLCTYLGGLDGRFVWLARTLLPERIFDMVMRRIMLGHWGKQ